METGNYIKPPWVLAERAWQQPSYTQPISPSHIIFSEWKETPCESLVRAKDSITRLENEGRWELVKKMVNPYEIIYTHEDKHFHPSIAIVKPLSRSYFKMIEMAHVLGIFENMKNAPKLRTAHVAEGPGGFIQGVVELCNRHKKTLQVATAMTLKSTDQRVPGWRRASSFLHHHREVRLHYGADDTGDIYKVENQDSFVKAVEPVVNLFTADGGFDFSVNYAIQEKCVFRLLVCSATVGLRCLSRDGSFVLKIFESFSESTQLLIVLMGRCFQEWMLYKPALSRPCNSERYFLGRGFNRLSSNTLQILMAMQAAAAEDKYPLLSGITFTESEAAYLKHNMEMCTKDQEKAIERAHAYATHPETWYSTQLPHDFKTSKLWCEQFRVPYNYAKHLTIEMPIYSPFPAVCISEQDAVQQSQLPGDDSTTLVPSYRASPT